MAKQGAKAATPRLRFPEFRNDSEWSESRLGTRTTIVRGGSPRPIEAFLTADPYGLNWLKIGDVDREAKYVTRTEERVRAEALSKTRVIHPGDFILSNSMSFGRPYISTIKTCIHDGWIAITEIPASLSHEFLYYSILSERSQKYFVDQAAGSGVQNLNKDIIKLLSLGIPSRAEQQKIADCLTSLDEVIAAQGRKVEALKAHKRGLMQQLFPREGETRPRLRFPEFCDAPEWEVKKLSASINLVSGMHLSPDQYSSSGDVPYFTGPSDFTNDVDGVTKWTSSSSSVAKEHDTLITVKGSGVGECWYLGMPSVAMGRQLMAVRSKASSSQFIYQFLLTKRSRFEDLASGNLIPGLARGDILDMVAPFPKKDEQQRIADCLSSIDTQITAESNQLAALKTHKQGLMQQLFPASENSVT
ncbi:MAG TPA: restriction endonuclease subunit S [Rhodanobacter sp.]|nr:restriction endonuclease subunit S [Rhodanobacter sp.]